MSSVGVMASAVVTGGCTAVLNESFANFTAAPWTLTGTPTIVSGRTGTAANFFSTTQRADFNIPTPAQADTVTVGFAFRRTDTQTGGRSICQLYSDSGATQHNQLSWTLSSTTLAYTRAGTNLATNAAITFTQNTWYYIEVQTKLHDTTGFVIVRINGVDALNATGLDTRNAGTKSVYDQLRLICGFTSATNQYDDLYLTSGSDCTFQGDHTIP